MELFLNILWVLIALGLLGTWRTQWVHQRCHTRRHSVQEWAAISVALVLLFFAVSLLSVLALAGGLTRGAAATKARIIHVGPDGSRSQPAIVNLKTIMNGKALDLELTAGDILIVPPASGLKSSIEALGMSAATTSIWIGLLATL